MNILRGFASSGLFVKIAFVLAFALCCAAIEKAAKLKLTNQLTQLMMWIGKNKRSPDPTEIPLTPTIDGRTFYGRVQGAWPIVPNTDAPKLHVEAFVWEKRPNDHRDNTGLKVIAEYSDPDKEADTLSFVAGSGSGSVAKFFEHYSFDEARSAVERKLDEMKVEIGEGIMKLKVRTS